MKATAKDLRFHTSELLGSVERGEEIVVTFRGKPCAKLVPYQSPSEEADRHELFGAWRDNESVRDVSAYVRNLRTGRF